MKALIGVIILVVVVGGIYFLTTSSPEAPDAMENKDDAIMDDDAMNDDGAMMEDDDAMMEGGEKKVFDVTGRNFAFSMSEIKVKKGDTVVINFSSTSGFHDWSIDEFGVATKQVAVDDGTTSIEFVADKTGTFEYYCSVGAHRAQGMIGNLVVE
ncbi:MAG: plastocyanin/azurin family copper-binding protein [bacterium]|nr:plastocyanin/azurin family copper-binding protein [bacterium]